MREGQGTYVPLLRRLGEALARRTPRRSLIGRGAEVATGALLGIAAGAVSRSHLAQAGATVCIFPGPPCPCDGCTEGGVCAKPCLINTFFYASGCWMTAGVTCCDCDCRGFQDTGVCGCGSDYHNNPAFCP